MDLAFIPFVFPGVAGVRCAFQTKTWFAPRPESQDNISLDIFSELDAEQSAVAQCKKAREAIACLPGVHSFAEAKQVHGVHTLFEALPQEAQKPPLAQHEADGLTTSQPGLALMIKTADCQPILITHAKGRFVAALHAGWRGNAQNYPGLAVTEICEHYNVYPQELLAVRGPSLGPAASEFINFSQEWDASFSPWFHEQTKTMDLWRLSKDQLLAAGLLPGHIFGLDLCTYSLPHMFFSYRKNRQCGRQASFIWINSASGQ